MPKTAIFIICLFILPASGGCGRKTMVVAPDTVRPATVRDVVIIQDDTGISLNWSRPTKNPTGADLDKPVTLFEVERAATPIRDFCPGCPEDFRRIARIKIPPAQKPSWRDHDLEPGQVYSYRIIAKTDFFGRSLPSAPITAVWGEMPPEPAPPVIVIGDGLITLTWTADPDYGYELEKTTTAGTTVLKSGAAGEGNLVFRDHRVKNGSEYGYRLRLRHDMGKGLRVRGPASKTVIAVPRDLTPPPVVMGVRAIRTANGVNVFWEPLMTADLAGYRIYRQDHDFPELIGTAGPQETSFTDHDPPAADQWQYRVTAIDQAIPANESEPSMAAVTRRTR